LRASAALQEAGLDFFFFFVGSGRDRQSAELLAQELNLRNAHFHPGQAPPSLPAVYSSADVLIFPTLEDPWGLVANEAMLAGIPVLCSKYAGCAEELFPAESIFDPENPVEFRQKLGLAVNRRLPAPDLSRLKTTKQVAADLIAALENSSAGTQAPIAESGKLPA
jgi:glycosyltransferase involved in cell wall biosynthesis